MALFSNGNTPLVRSLSPTETWQSRYHPGGTRQLEEGSTPKIMGLKASLCPPPPCTTHARTSGVKVLTHHALVGVWVVFFVLGGENG